MSTCSACCKSALGCKHQWIYFIIAAGLWAYALATLLIPADFPLMVGHVKDALLVPSLAVVAFNAGFVAVNIAIGAVANAQFNKALAGTDDYLLTKLRNAFVAAFGFTALMRVVVFLIWVLGYTS